MSHLALFPLLLIVIVPILIVGVLILLLVLFVRLLFRLAGGGNGGGSGELRQDEARTIQELHAQLERMEKRIESLETILLDKVKSRRDEAH